MRAGEGMSGCTSHLTSFFCAGFDQAYDGPTPPPAPPDTRQIRPVRRPGDVTPRPGEWGAGRRGRTRRNRRFRPLRLTAGAGGVADEGG